MKKISSSPERYSFGKSRYEETLANDPNNESALHMVDYYNNVQQQHIEKLKDPKFQENNLEYDLRSTDWVLEKVRASEIYSQNLYAALCNNEFVKRELWPILKDERWSCSWRYAGGIIADMREEGDYIDWYCSGISGDLDYNAPLKEGRVPESVVTEEIEIDLNKLGWLVIKDNE